MRRPCSRRRSATGSACSPSARSERGLAVGAHRSSGGPPGLAAPTGLRPVDSDRPAQGRRSQGAHRRRRPGGADAAAARHGFRPGASCGYLCTDRPAHGQDFGWNELLSGADIELTDDILDRIDEIVPPGDGPQPQGQLRRHAARDRRREASAQVSDPGPRTRPVLPRSPSATPAAGRGVRGWPRVAAVRVVAVRTRLAIASSGLSPARSVSTNRASALTTAARSCLSWAVAPDPCRPSVSSSGARA